jgi:hypothetical protein
MNDIFAAVGAERAEPYELVEWLRNYSDGQIYCKDHEIIIIKDSMELIRLKFSKCNRLTSFKVHNSLSGKIAEIRDAIDSDLLNDANNSVWTVVFFSSFPVDGFFKFENKLLIRPVPAQAPKPSSRSFGEQPFLLEFKFAESRNSFITSFRKAQTTRHLGAVLAVFLEGVIIPQTNTIRGHWVNVQVNKPGEEILLESRYMAGQYICPPIERRPNELSSPEGFPAIVAIPEQIYFARRDQLLGRSLEIPDSLHKLFTIFFSLQPEERAKFVQAAWWFAQAKSAYQVSKSYQYVALVTAIETLAEREVDPKRCPECNRELENGPTKNFRRFLDEYAPNLEGADALKRDLYTVRCELIHGGRLFLEDIDSRFFSLMPSMVDDANKRTMLYQLAQIAIVNWLSKKGGKLAVRD